MRFPTTTVDRPPVGEFADIQTGDARIVERRFGTDRTSEIGVPERVPVMHDVRVLREQHIPVGMGEPQRRHRTHPRQINRTCRAAPSECRTPRRS